MEASGPERIPSPVMDTIIDAPSGFILKLFQMITDADDELVKVSSFEQVVSCRPLHRLAAVNRRACGFDDLLPSCNSC